MNTWVKQQGYPLISVCMRQDDNCRLITLTQEKFNADGTKDPNQSKWMIPINIITQNCKCQVGYI